MKIVNHRYMIAFIISLFISCGTIKPVTNPIVANLDAFPVVEFSNPLPIKQKDTLTIQDKAIHTEYKNLSAKIESKPVPYDTLASYNQRWQSLAFTLFERGIRNRDKADRSEQLFKAIQDSLNARDKRDMLFRSQQATVKRTIAVQRETFNMFNIILLICLSVCTTHALIELLKWILIKLKPSHA